MAVIYKTTDKIRYKIGEIEVALSPLSSQQKAQLTETMSKAAKGDYSAAMEGSLLTIQNCLKEISGVTNSDGSPYELEFQDGILTRECAEDLTNMEQSTSLVQLCAQYLAGIPSELPEGVTLKPMGKKTTKKQR